VTSELAAFIQFGRDLAEANKLAWNLPFDPDTGSIPRAHWWDLSAVGNSTTGQRVHLSTFATLPAAHEPLTSMGGCSPASVMSEAWIEFYKAIALQDILVLGNRPTNFATNVGPSFRILAAAAGPKAPHELSSDQVQLGFNAALILSASAKRASTLKALIVRWFDAPRDALVCPTDIAERLAGKAGFRFPPIADAGDVRSSP
jgi:hypothetical protein